MEFWEKYKKLIFIILFLVISVFLGYTIFLFFFKPIISQPEKSNPIETSSPASILPSAASSTFVKQKEENSHTEPVFPENKASDVALGGLTKTKELNQSATLSPTGGNNGSALQYYDQDQGKFFKISKDGQISTLSEKVFHNAEKITWANDKNKAIIEFPDETKIIYNFSTEKQVTLPKHWKDFDFSPDSDKIVSKSIGLDPNNRWLIVSDQEGGKISALESLGNNEETVYPSWSPTKQIAAMYVKGIDFNRQEVYFVGLNNENFKSTVIEGRGFQPKWSPSGDKLLYSVYSSDNEMKPSLWVVNAVGDSIGSGRKNLRIETWAEKCAYADTDNIYCAVPENLPDGSGLFTDLAKTTKDQLYKINTQTGLKKLIATTEEAFNMSNLIVSDNGANLYFTDQTNKRLHQIRLK